MSKATTKNTVLIISTPCNARYCIDRENGNISHMGTGLEPSGKWRFLGLQHVKINMFIPLALITKKFLVGFKPCWKNGNPQFTVKDFDHGTVRVWGNTVAHGVKDIYIEKKEA